MFSVGLCWMVQLLLGHLYPQVHGGLHSFLRNGQDAASHDDKDPGSKSSLRHDSSWSWGSTGEGEAVWDKKN